MPDVIVSCPECGAERVISEYATMDTLACLVCQAKLEMPSFGRATGLALKRSADPKAPPVMLTDVDPPKEETSINPVAVVEAAVGGTTHINVHEGRAEDGKSRGWIATLTFVVVAAILIGFQFKHEALSSYTVFYLWGRGLLTVGAFLLVVLIAFQDSLGMGALCLFFPPYALIYTAASVESHILRGAFFAVLVALCTELYFMQDQALATAMAHHMGGLIDTVDNLIVRASGPPI